MYKLLILAVLITTTLTGILSAAAVTHPVLPPLPPRPPVTGSPANSSRGDTMVHHQQHLQPRSEDGEREPVQRAVHRRRRRSINIPDPDKPKVNRLLKVNRNRFLEVTWDGHVVTTTTSNSAYSKLEVQFMCQLFPEQFRPCSPWLADRPRRLPDQERDNQDQDQDQYQDQRSTYSAVLLRFTETNRYLCIDESANIYTRPDASTHRGAETLDISECVFHHDFLPNQYDVYSSQKYPRNTSRCLRTAAAADPGRSRRPGGGGGKARYCDRRWYVGVNRKAEVVTVKTSRAPSQKAFFIQRWVHDQPSQTSPQFNVNPHREAKLLGNSSNSSSSVISRSGSSSSSTKQPEMDSSSRRPSRNRSTSSSSVSVGRSRVKPQHGPVYRFLTRPSASLFRKRHRGKGLKGKAGCSNLLKNCDDDEEAEQEQEKEELEKEEERDEDERQAKLFSHRRPKRRRERKRKSRTTS